MLFKTVTIPLVDNGSLKVKRHKISHFYYRKNTAYNEFCISVALKNGSAYRVAETKTKEEAEAKLNQFSKLLSWF